MRHRITLETQEVELLLSAIGHRRQNILEEMLAPGMDQDQLVEAAEAVRQHDSATKRLVIVLSRKGRNESGTEGK